MPIERVFRFNKNRKIAKPVEDIKPIALPYNKDKVWEQIGVTEEQWNQLKEIAALTQRVPGVSYTAIPTVYPQIKEITGGMIYTQPSGYYTSGNVTNVMGTSANVGQWNNNVQVWTGNGWSGTVTKSTL